MIKEQIGGEQLHNCEGIYSSTDAGEMRLGEEERGFTGH